MSMLEAENISVSDSSGQQLLKPVSLSLQAGQPLVILGETGSGKSLLAQALVGTLPEDLRAGGKTVLQGRPLDAGDPAAIRTLWGKKIVVLPQEPWLALDPLMRGNKQIADAHRFVAGQSARASLEAADRDLLSLGLGESGTRYPHELSGGMAQRVAFAAARAGGAQIMIADEPTKGLDSDRRDDVADLLMREVEVGGALMIITHDLVLAKRIGGKLMVIREGKVVEAGDTKAIFASPQHSYTKSLIAADPENWPNRPLPKPGKELLTVQGLAISRGGRELASSIDFSLLSGSILGVSGPSGSGKSTLGNVLLGLQAPAAGEIVHQSARTATSFQKLYQDPVSAFAPKRKLGATLNDVAKRFSRSMNEVKEQMQKLGLAQDLLLRRPTQVSGGELQRLSLLRAMLVNPTFLFADEPTSRLDPITQQQIINHLLEYVENGLAVLLVSHDKMLLKRTCSGVIRIGNTPEPLHMSSEFTREMVT